MTVSYNDLINLANVLESSNPTAQEKYNTKFADRSSNDFNPQVNSSNLLEDDLHVLLNALVGKINTSWVGQNCTYTEGACSVDDSVGSGLSKMVTPDTGPYSKCKFGDSGSGDYINPSGESKQWDCGELQECPKDFAYYWKVEPNIAQIRYQNSAYLGTLKDIAKPGRCEKIYLANENQQTKTNNPDDDFIDPADSNSVPPYNCMPFGHVIDKTSYPNQGANESDYKILKANGARGIALDIEAGSIQDQCASNPIRYDVNYSTSINSDFTTSDKYNFDGETNPDWNLPYAADPTSSGYGDFINSGETRDCKIRATYAKYVKKGDYSQECQPTMPLYPGSALAATYDLPLDGETPEQWWDENSCVWVNALPFDSALNANFLAFEPQILNGSCRYDDFVAKGADGIYRNIEDNSDANMPSLGSDTPATDGGCFGMEDDNNDGECKNITALIDHDTLKQISDSYGSQGVSGIDKRLFPGIDHPKTDNPNFEEADNCANYDFQCAWIKGNLSDDIGADNPSVSSNYISGVGNTENTDANDTTGKYKLYAKAFTGNSREYSYPCYYDDGTFLTSSDPHYLLEDDNYRGVLIKKNSKPTNCSLVPQKMELQYPTNHGGAGWYTSESDGHIDPDARGKLNTLKQQGSSVADVQGVRLTGNDTTNSSISPEPYGYGDGEMWTKARVSQYPSYVNADIGILKLGDTVTENISEELNTKFGSNNRDNIIKELARGEVQDNRTFFYESVPADIPTSVDGVAQLEYAWVPPTPPTPPPDEALEDSVKNILGIEEGHVYAPIPGPTGVPDVCADAYNANLYNFTTTDSPLTGPQRVVQSYVNMRAENHSCESALSAPTPTSPQ